VAVAAKAKAACQAASASPRAVTAQPSVGLDMISEGVPMGWVGVGWDVRFMMLWRVGHKFVVARYLMIVQSVS
jgi:hypothetical protein